MAGALNQDQRVTRIEQKIEQANSSLKMLPHEEQPLYRQKINSA
jgi:hypothetical protein